MPGSETASSRGEAAVAEPNRPGAFTSCPNGPLSGIEPLLVVWAFPVGQADRSMDSMGMGDRIDMSIAARSHPIASCPPRASRTAPVM